MIPEHVITEFWGSGKTTLLQHLLRDPAVGRTAMIMNEFGEAGIDHASRRAEVLLPPDEWVVVETTGLADPAPILHALMSDRDSAEIFMLCNIGATVDEVNALGTWDRHEQSARQITMAERVVITKTDLPLACKAALTKRILAATAREVRDWRRRRYGRTRIAVYCIEHA